MVLFQVVDLALDALVVLPLYVGSRVGRPVIGDRVILNGLLLAELRSFEFVPFVVGQGVAVGVLHYIDDTRFG